MKNVRILRQYQFENARCYSHDSFHVSNRRKLYEVLGLEPNATQAEIKSAYYKLSMVCHPDKSKDSEEAKVKFQQINEAYEILGNYELRRKYDRGIFRPKRAEATYTEAEHVDVHSDFFKSRQLKTHKEPPSGRTQIYNFDEFYRMHYGETIKREARTRRNYKEFVEERRSKASHKMLSLLQAVMLVTVFGGMIAYVESSFLQADKSAHTTNKK